MDNSLEPSAEAEFTRHAVTIILRLWPELLERPPHEPAIRWLGEAVHVQSGARMALRSLDGLVRFVNAVAADEVFPLPPSER